MFDPNLKPYPDYKSSGVEWLGDVPTHWEVRRLKYLLQERDTRSADGHERLLRVSQYTGVTQRKGVDGSDDPDTRAESLIGYKCVEHNDLVVNIMLAWNGSMGVSKFRGITSPAYCVYRFLDGAHPWFFHYLLRSPIYKAYIKNESTGIVDSRLRLYTDNLYRLYAFILPLPEQIAIVRFLDHADQRIRRYIRAKQKLIALLEEQKQAIIHQAITGQIDVRTGQPYPAYRDSGLKWLGDVPEHWEVLPLKRAFVSMEYGISDSGSDAGTISLLTMGNIRDGEVTVPRYGGVTSVDPSLLLQDKDLLFNRTNSSELVAKVGLFRAEGRPVTFASYLVRMRTLPENSPEFLNLLLNDVGFVAIARREAIPSLHQSNLNPTRYGRLKIPFPPPSEQEAIVQGVTEGTSGVNAAIVRTNREIDHLREYLTRLIADVVTGKLDVREAAAELPEEAVSGDAEQSAEEHMIEEEVTV